MDNQPNKTQHWLIRLTRGIFKGPLQYLSHHKRCLNVAAVILIIFGVLSYLDLPVKVKKDIAGNKWWQAGDELIEEKASDLQIGILGGPIGIVASAIPATQASMDFSADDALENQDLINRNNIGLLEPGMIGNVFSGIQKEPTTYTVQQGDSPFSIALKFGINTDTILIANNLRDGDLIRPGQQLLILPINGVRVKVVAKDTMASLAKKYNGKADEIKAFNGIYEDSKLVVGSFIMIPDGEMPSLVVTKPKITAPKYAKDTTSSGWLIFPTTGRDWGRIHGQNGVDIANACGTPIYAAAAGTVILSDDVGWNFGYGKYIMIKHSNSVVTVYGHAARLLVDSGEKVDQGQLIALMGTTGRSTGCHLHFEVRGAKNPLAGAKTIR